MADFTIPASAALLLEGGSLRGLYTSGVLDILMERELYFPAVAGVSAGALNAVNYLAKQPGRAASINLRYRHDPKYFGPLAALNSGSMFGLTYLLRDLAIKENFDAETFAHSAQRLVVTATNIRTGKAAYFEKGKTDFDFLEAVRASATLPLVSVPVKLGDAKYLDGGCACPIPLKWALGEGFEKIVVVTTRNKGFRKEMPSQRMVDMYSDFYSKYPLLLATLLTNEVRYNDLMDQIDALEEEGRLLVLRPQTPIEIGRFEGNTERLLDLYNQGRKETRAALPRLAEYLAQ